MAFKPIQIIIGAKDEASKVIDGLSARIKTVGVAVAAYFGINAFAGVVKGAADLEAAMSKVQAATGATKGEMQAMEGAADKAIAGTAFTAIDAAGSLENLGKAGLSATDAMQTLAPVVALASAGNLDLAASSDIMTKVVMGMGLAWSDAARVADVLAKGANATNTSVEGLGQALSYTAPIARTLGVSLEGTVAMIGKLADAGIDASRAGTALNSMMSQFADPASKFKQELRAAGITTNSFEEALKQMAAAGPAASKAINAVGLESGPALRSLLNQGMGALTGLKTELQNAGGSAKSFGDILRSNLNGSLSALNQAWTALTNTLGKPVLPILQSGVDKLAETFRAWVADGTIGKLGDSIAKTFEAGIKWVQQFIASFDLDALTAKVSGFADRAGAAMTDFGNKAAVAGGIVQTAYGIMSAGASGVMTAVYLLGGAFTRLLENVSLVHQKVLEFFSKISFGDMSKRFKEEADRIRIETEGLGAAAEALEAKARESFAGMADGAQTAREGFEKVNGTIEDNTAAVVDSNRAYKDALAMADAGQAQMDKEYAAAQKTTAAIVDKKAALADLRAQYAEAAKSGDVQRMAELQGQMKAAFQGTTGAMKEQAAQASATSEAVVNAFTDLGVVSTAQLKTAAANARKSFETIRDAGTSTPEDIANAWEAYSKKAIAANKGVEDSALKTEGSIYKLRDAAKVAGTTGGQEMDGAERSTRAVGDAAREAAAGYQQMGDEAEAAGEKAERAAERQKLAMQRTDNMGHDTRSAGGKTWLSIYNDLKSNGLDEESARKGAGDFVDAMGNVTFFNNAGQKKWRGNTLDAAIGNLVQDYFLNGKGKDLAQAEANKTKEPVSAVPAPAPTAAPTASPSRASSSVINNITLIHNGQQEKFGIETVNGTDSDLQRLLKKLDFAAKVAQ